MRIQMEGGRERAGGWVKKTEINRTGCVDQV